MIQDISGPEKAAIGPTGRACWGGARRGSTLCYAMVLPGRKSDFRAGFWPDCYWESTEVGLQYKFKWFGDTHGPEPYDDL